MTRWVERKGHHVTFGNVVGPYCGNPYRYRCATIEGAEQFKKYCEGIDREGMPVSVTPEIAARYGAVQIKETP